MVDPANSSRRPILMMVYPGIQNLDVIGPLEVFAAATEVLEERGDPGGYILRVAGSEPGLVRGSSGISLSVDLAYEDLPTEIDTLMVAGGRGTTQAFVDPRVIECTLRASARARRVASRPSQ